jgi:hypothetical protein
VSVDDVRGRRVTKQPDDEPDEDVTFLAAKLFEIQLRRNLFKLGKSWSKEVMLEAVNMTFDDFRSGADLAGQVLLQLDGPQ